MIGIIGGAGVAATNKLCELIEIKLTQDGCYRDNHHPEILIYQATKAPSRSMYLEGRGESFIDDYVTVGKRLKTAGADLLCMCCNTAHYAIDEIQSQVQLPFINMIEEVIFEVRKRDVKNVGLIASDGCLKGKVYEKYFEKHFPDANLIYPNIKYQEEVTKGICNIKNTNRFLKEQHPERPKNIFTHVYDHLMSEGADCVIIGCTDIRVDFEHHQATDSLEVLVNKIIKIKKQNGE